MVNSNMVTKQENSSTSKSWSLVLIRKGGSSRRPSSQIQTVEVFEDILHVKTAVYEPASTSDGKIISTWNQLLFYSKNTTYYWNIVGRLYKCLIYLVGYGSADLYVSLNGGSETQVYRFDTQLSEFEVDLDSIDYLKFEKGTKVCIIRHSLLE